MEFANFSRFFVFLPHIFHSIITLSKANETKGMKIGRRVLVKSAMEITRKKKSKK